MTPEETAIATAPGVSAVPSRFMLDPATYQRGGELGFNGLDFYVAGRGGALGDVPADVVSAAFVFFNPAMVAAAWDAAGSVMSRAQAGTEWAGSLRRWVEEHAPDGLDYARLAELARRCVDEANPAGAPVFAGWRRLPRPDDPKVAAVHELNALRELRGGLHGGAVLASGLRPLEAVAVRTPQMAGLFGWAEQLPDPAANEEQWAAAEAGTNRAMAPVFDVLDEAERAELASLVADLHAATGG